MDLNHRFTVILDTEDPMSSSGLGVCAGYDPQLDWLKTRYAALGEFLTSVAMKDVGAGHIPESVQTFSYAYFPQLGYFFKVRRDVLRGFEWNLALTSSACVADLITRLQPLRLRILHQNCQG